VEILEAVKEAKAGRAPKKISIASGRGIGKTATTAWLVLWGLFNHKDAQIACTAPTTTQMSDVLWKEVAVWIQRMPEPVKVLYEWSTTHVRMASSPSTWFASAKTGRKENPEALAGVHGEFVMIIADEASGVPTEIFKTAESGLTEEDYLFLMFSNYRRLTGYFHQNRLLSPSHVQKLTFSSLDSPLVDNASVEKIRHQYGEGSDDYRVEVLGLPPKEDSLDDQGFAPLIQQTDLHEVDSASFFDEKVLGIDVAGEGDNKTVWVLRDRFKAQILATEAKSTSKSVAAKTLTLMEQFNVPKEMVVVDGFGIGAETCVELTGAGQRPVMMIVADDAKNKKKFLNIRAEKAFDVREWLRDNGELVRHKGWQDCLEVRYRRDLKGRLKLMTKDDMRKLGIESPDYFDALMLTFCIPLNRLENTWQEEVDRSAGRRVRFQPMSD